MPYNTCTSTFLPPPQVPPPISTFNHTWARYVVNLPSAWQEDSIFESHRRARRPTVNIDTPIFMRVAHQPTAHIFFLLKVLTVYIPSTLFSTPFSPSPTPQPPLQSPSSSSADATYFVYRSAYCAGLRRECCCYFCRVYFRPPQLPTRCQFVINSVYEVDYIADVCFADLDYDPEDAFIGAANDRATLEQKQVKFDKPLDRNAISASRLLKNIILSLFPSLFPPSSSHHPQHHQVKLFIPFLRFSLLFELSFPLSFPFSPVLLFVLPFTTLPYKATTYLP